MRLRALRRPASALLACAALLAAALGPAPAAAEPAPVDKPRYFSFNLTRDGVYYMPIGTHYGVDDLARVNMVGLTKGPLSFAVYASTLEGEIYSIAQGREVFAYRRLGADIVYGLLYGYHGELADAPNIPDFARPLFEGEINPFLALSPYVSVTENIEARVMITPGLVALGVKYGF